jgi:hypothetical protein
VAEPVYTFALELATGSLTNVTSRLERADWSNGIVDMLRPPAVGRGLFELANWDGELSPANNSELYPGRKVQLKAVSSVGSEFTLFTGRVTDITFTSEIGKRTAIIEAVDDWDRIKRLTYTTSLFLGTKVTSLFTELMSLSNVASFAADADISDTVGFAWYRDRDAANALFEIVQSGNYQLQVDGAGTYRLRGRYWQQFATAVGTYSEQGMSRRYGLSEESILNRVKYNARPRQLTTSPKTIAFISEAMTIPASQSIGFWLTYQDPDEPSVEVPVSSHVAQVASADYYAAAESTGSGTNLTSGISVSITKFAATAVATITNNNAEQAYLTRFQLIGYPIRQTATVGARADVTSSQTKYGLRELVIDNPAIQDRGFLNDLSRVVALERKDGRAQLRYNLINEFPDILSNGPGDILAIVDDFSGYTGAWRVRTANHELNLLEGTQHRVTYDMESFATSPWFVLDHNEFGVLDNERILGA